MNLSDVTLQVKSTVRAVVACDLRPSLNRRVAILLASGIFGGLASLAVCGQFGFGLTNWASTFSSHIHESMPAWQCSVICGVLFAVFPVALLRLLTSPMLFHVLISRHFVEVALLLGSTGAVLAVFGHHGNTLGLFLIWVFAVVATTWCTSRLVRRVTPHFQLFQPATEVLRK